MNDVALLGDVCQIMMGQAPPGHSYNDQGEGVPLVAGAGDFAGTTPSVKKFTTAPGKVSRKGDIILGIRASIGERVWSDRAYCLGRGVAGLRPSEKLDPNYLWHWLGHSADRLKSKGRGATFLQVNRADINEMEIPLPSLDEQRRIAAILDQADAVRLLRRDVIRQIAELSQSIFMDMFGDLPTSSFAQVSEVCERITVGVVVKPASYYVEHGVPALRTLNVKPGSINESELVYFSQEDNDGPLAKSKLRSGDLVVSRTGRAGVAALVPAHLDGANAIDLIVVTPHHECVDGRYFETMLNSPIGARLVLGEQRGQIQQHFNVGSLKTALLPFPELDRQREFARRIDQVRTVMADADTQLVEIDAIIAALQSRAFAGQL